MNDTRANQWVPVSERLPGLYLGSTSKKLVLLNDGCVRVAYLNGERWRDPHASTFIETVTHWMDLPESPEPPKPADPFEAWWTCASTLPRVDGCKQLSQAAWNAAKEHYAKPLPDFETWAKAHCADGPYLAVLRHPITKQLIQIDHARGIWNAAQGKPEA